MPVHAFYLLSSPGDRYDALQLKKLRQREAEKIPQLELGIHPTLSQQPRFVVGGQTSTMFPIKVPS